MDNDFGLNNSNLSGFSRGRSSNELTVDQLLGLAKSQGGAVAEVAEELSNPNRSILSTIGNGFKNAFTGFLDIIAAPSQIVAGAVSKEYTIEQALRENISVSDVVFGKYDPAKEDSTFAKVGSFVARTAVDLLTDPLTYVTFGATRGVLGFSAAPKFFASEKGFRFTDDTGRTLAQRAGVDQIGDSVYLNEAGEDLANRFLESQRKGLRHTYLKKERQRLIDAELAAGKSLDEIDQQKISTMLREIDDKTQQYVIEEALNTRLSKSFAVGTVGKLIEKNPALIETLVDKGGIKFFGKSILSGQRIKASMFMIPGMTALDNVTKGPRDALYGIFNRRGTAKGRLSDEVTRIDQKYRDMADEMNNELLLKANAMYKELGLTAQEQEFVTAAIEGGLRPTDPKAQEIWDALHGIEPSNGIIRDEVWQAVGLTRQQLKRNLRLLRKSGAKVSNFANYFPHILVKEEVGRVGFRTPPRKTSNRMKMASISTLVNKETGERFPVQFDGRPRRDGVVAARALNSEEELINKTYKYIASDKEIARIEELAKRRGRSIKQEIERLRSEIRGIKTGIEAKVGEEATNQILDMISGVKTLSAAEKKEVAEIVSSFVDDTNINTMLSRHITQNYSKGVKVPGQGEISAPDIKKVIREAVERDQSTREIAAALRANVKKMPEDEIRGAPKKRATGKASRETLDAEKDPVELAKEIKKQAKAGRERMLREGLDEDAVRQFITKAVDKFSDNPTGFTSALDRIFRRSQQISDLGDEFTDIARSVQLDREELAEMGGKFVDPATGKVLERERATIEEARKFGVNFETNALAVMMQSSYDAIKTSVSRDFIKEAGQKLGVPKSMAEEGWRAVNISDLKVERMNVGAFLRNQQGEELVFHPKVADYLEKFGSALGGDEPTQEVLRWYDKLQNLFKATVTSIFPAFHGRNAISNVMLNFLDIGYHALRPSYHVAAGDMIRKNAHLGKIHADMIKGVEGSAEKYRDLMSQVVWSDNTGYNWTFGELREVIKKNVVAFHPRNLGQIDQTQFTSETIREAAEKLYPTSKKDKIMVKFNKGNPFSTDNYAVQYGFKAGQLVEDQSRLVNFLANLENTGDPLLAAERTKMFLFDYQNLSNFERTFLRRLIPFYTFSRKNLELQVKTLFQRPGAIAGEIRAVQTLGSLFGSGDDLSDEERAALPDWVQDGINTVLKRDGSHVTLLSTIGTPIEQPFQQFSPNQALASISPIARVPVELMSNYSFFHGKSISEVTNAAAFKSAPAPLKKAIGFTEVTGRTKDGEEFTYYVSLRPKNMHMILNLPPMARMWTTIKQMQKEDVPRQVKLWQSLVGFNPYEFDLDVEAARRENEIQEELERALDSVNAGYSFSRFVPTE